ncbi:MAG: hypothetical protein IT456_28105 [Planctomycetes bacterium]|nr:hypothetical protein [Planctomycetota bacterium]
MARAHLLKLHAARPPELERSDGESQAMFEERLAAAFSQYFSTARVQPLGGYDLRDSNLWEKSVQPERKRTAGAAGDQLQLLKQMLALRVEFSAALSQVYQVDAEGVCIAPEPVCGGCPVCRRESNNFTAYAVPRPVAPLLPIREPDQRLRSAAGVPRDSPTAVITYAPPLGGRRERRRWDDLVLRVLLPRLIVLGVREISTSSEWTERPAFRRLHRLCPERYLFYAPPGERDGDGWVVPRVTLLDPADPPAPVPAELFRLVRPFHLIVIPETARDPYYPTDTYRSRNPTTPLNALLSRLDR